MNRRGFLKSLGKGAAVGAAMATPAAYASGMDIGTGKDKSALHFTCPMCSQSMVAEVPEKVGTIVEMNCACDRPYQLRWDGGSFTTYRKGDLIQTQEQERERQIAYAADPTRHVGDLKKILKGQG